MDKKDIEVVLDSIDEHVMLIFKLESGNVYIDLEWRVNQYGT